MKPQTIGFLVLAIIAVFLVATVAERMREGRCHAGRGGLRRAFDCSYPATAPSP